MVFQPPLDTESPGNFLSLMESLVEDMFRCSTLVARVAPHSNADTYLTDMDEVNKVF